MRTVLRRTLLVLLGVVIAGGVLLWALPEIVRRVVVDQVPRRFGRAITIEDVDLNLFTRRLSARNVRVAEREGTEAFVEVKRLDARFAPTALVRRDIHVTDLALIAPATRVVRTAPGAFNVSDLLPASDGVRSGWTVTVDRLTIDGGAVHARDEVVAPPAEWEMRELHADVGEITTRSGAAPGRGTLRARLDEATLDVTATSLRLDPLTAVVTIALDGFALRRLAPYIAQAGTRYSLTGGRLGAALTAWVDHDADTLTKAAFSGTVSVEGESVARTDQDDPVLDIARAVVRVKDADAITRSLTVESVDVEGATLRTRRDAQGVIDLLEMFGAITHTSRAGAPAPPVPPGLFPALGNLPYGFERVLVEQVTLGASTVTWVDEAVTPTTTLALTGTRATMTDLTWPPTRPAALTFSATLPGGGTLDIKGPVMTQPIDADLDFRVRNAPIEPYQIYIPGRGKFRGRFSGDSRHRIARRDDGTMLLASKGHGWAEGVEVRVPGAGRPAFRVERMDLVGIDFDWPARARVGQATFRRPRAEIVREADGKFDVATLFTTPDAPAHPRASPRAEPPKDLLATMRLDFEKIRVEDGFARFLDRTTQPAFSKDLSRLTMTVDNLTNRPGARARVAVQSIVGGDSTLDLRGEIGAIGAPAFVDLVGELGGLQLAGFNPYTAPGIGWVVTQGDVQYKVRFTLDGDALDATNELVLGQLRVAPASGADEVKRRIGLPLGFIVALAKDGNGEIHINVLLSGSIHDPTFDMRASVWTALRNAIAGIVRAPFRAISRSLRNGDTLEEPSVDPVTFAPGSTVLAPDMEKHLLRVADFLRRSPFVNLALAPTATPADAEALKTQALLARLRTFKEEHGLSEGPGVVAAYFAERLPDVAPPTTVEARLALLREHEPMQQELLGELARRRVDVTRERLVSIEGIPAERLEIDEPRAGAAPPPDDAGRVEFTVVARAE